jgi:hypothetical protein
LWHPQVGVDGARTRARTPRPMARTPLPRIDNPSENSHMAAALGRCIRARGSLARSLLSLKDKDGWLRQSWLTGTLWQMPPPRSYRPREANDVCFCSASACALRTVNSRRGCEPYLTVYCCREPGGPSIQLVKEVCGQTHGRRIDQSRLLPHPFNNELYEPKEHTPCHT